MRYSILLLFLAIFLPPSFLYGQSIACNHYSQGLAHSTVYSLLQDRKGFMWFGTGAGVSRFDGITCSNFGAGRGLANEYVIAMAEGADGKIWLGTWGGGLYIYDHDTIQAYHDETGSIPKKIKRLFIDSKGRIWMGDNYLLGFLSGKKYTNIDIVPFVRHGGQICAVAEDVDGTIVIGTTRGLFHFVQNKLEAFSDIPDTIPAYAMERGNDRSLWISSLGKVYHVQHGTTVGVYTDGFSPNDHIWVLKGDSMGRIWGASYQSGAFMIEGNHVSNISSLLHFRNVQINAFQEDHEGNTWIATYGMGAYCIHSLQCTNYTTDDGLTNNYVLSMCKGNGNAILVGTRDGVSMIDQDTVATLPLPDYGEPFTYASALLLEQNGTLWIALNNEVLRKERGRQWKYDRMNTVRGLYQEKSGIVWFWSDGDMRQYERGKVSLWKNGLPLMGRRVFTMLKDQEGKLWFATDSGIFVCHDNLWMHYTTDNGLISNHINDIYEDQQGVWLASDKGISCFAHQTWRHITQKDGLRYKCRQLLSDGEGGLWIGTNHGLLHYNGTSFTSFTTADGLLSDEIQVLYPGENGILWIGTVRGVSKVDFRKSGYKIVPIPLYITNVATPKGSIQSASVIPYSENTLQLDFIGITYYQPENLLYEYRLEPTEQQWQATPNRSVRYSSLAPGNYTFMVRCQRTPHGAWSSIATFSFTITPPFWATWWFRLLLLGALSLIVYLLIKWRVSIEKHREMKELSTQYRVLQLEQKALQALMNPHFVFNALNSIHRYMNSNDHEQASNYLARFARLIRMTFESASNTYIDLEEEINRLSLYLSLEKLRFGEKLQYDIQLDANVDAMTTKVPSMILQPYVENAILHGIMPMTSGGMVRVLVRRQGEEHLHITIEDNGIGIEAARKMKSRNRDDEHCSSGMMLTEERLKLLSALAGMEIALHVDEIQDGEGNTAGTRVELIIPTTLAEAVS